MQNSNRRLSWWVPALLLLSMTAACAQGSQPGGGSPKAGLAANEITIHFKSSWTAAAPTIWVWEGTGASTVGTGNRPISQMANLTWPGPAMARDVVQDWWQWTVPPQFYPLGSGLKFKFAAGNQVDLTGAVSASVWFDGAAWSLSNPDSGTPGAGITVFTQGYSHIYWWGSTPANAPPNATWPGVAMSTDPASGWRTYRFPSATAINLLFSNNGAGQTADQTRTTGTWWFVNGTWSGQDPGGGGTGFPRTLGAVYTPSATKFRIWSPDSSNVTVNVAGATRTCTQIADFNGYTQIYEATVTGDLKGQTYQFAIGGTPVRDPYALMANPGTAQGVVVDIASVLPSDGSWAPRPALANREDSIIYEAHVRDFTIDASSGVDPAKRGKYLGMVQTGTTFNGARTGIDHLKELGITHVQILPFYDFGTGMYNWGYDPVNYNVPEEQYSQATTPEGRIRELKDMINEFHKNGIRVVMDVVYNHTFNKGVFQAITGRYYTGPDLSGTGNSIDDGDPMVSRMIRDSLEHWVRDYNIDGFRFDLIGVFYHANVASWWTYLNATYPDRKLLAYGEPWNGFAADPNEGQKVRLGKAPALASAHIGLFNSQYRQAIKGGSDDASRNYMFNAAQDPGSLWWGAIAAGARGSIEAVKSTNPLPNDWDSMFAYDPEQSINYLSAHDNFDLWDKISFAGAAGGATGYAGRVDRFGMGMILTSQGIPFIHAGDEFLRSKAFGGDYTTAKNTYNASDNYNMIRWADLVTNASVNAYYRDAIALRKATAALRLTTWDDINRQVRTTLNAGANNAASINVVNDSTLPANVVVSYLSSSAAQPTSYDVVVVFNPGNNFNASLPSGTWTKVFDINGAVTKADTVCEGTAVTVFKRN